MFNKKPRLVHYIDDSYGRHFIYRIVDGKKELLNENGSFGTGHGQTLKMYRFRLPARIKVFFLNRSDSAQPAYTAFYPALRRLEKAFLEGEMYKNNFINDLMDELSEADKETMNTVVNLMRDSRAYGASLERGDG